MKWYQITDKEVFKQLNSSDKGLSMEEAKIRSIKYGINELIEKKQKSKFQIFLSQFKDFMVIVLIVAAIISGFIGEITDTVIILIIIFLNAIIGFVQEYRAEEAMKALKKLSVLFVTTLRNGTPIKIPAHELVPGDVIFLESGNIIPADARLFEVQGLKVDESALSGESVASDKFTEPIVGENIVVGDQFNMVFKGTMVTNGRATAMVVATGMDTELGNIARLLQTGESTTPLQKRMADFGKKLSYLILGICALLFVFGIFRGEPPLQMLLLATSLAVAAIPEALPALITIALAMGAKRLVKQNALIRKLPAVETLGSVSFICSDKTGTLTLNKMKVMASWESSELIAEMPENNNITNNLLLALLLNHDVKTNEKGELLGDATEVALVEFVMSKLTDEEINNVNSFFPRIGEVAFDSNRKCMTTIHPVGDQFLVITKGAIERIGNMLVGGQPSEEALEKHLQWANEGLRVIAFSYRVIPDFKHFPETQELEAEMTFVGMVAMMDPPRDEVIQAIKECKSAGITTVMITGDHPATAAAIAKKIGILRENGLIVTGTELNEMGDDTFENQVEKISVYARVSPEQKLIIVKTLQAKGHFVAMTGDGVNDAPTLKAADIGIAMGINGTDVSKEAAHMILLDDNFSTIVKAIKEGRRIYDNIRKFVKYIMTCNSAEILTIFIASVVGMPVPLLPIHILWINLITDGLPGLALAGERAESHLMQQPPRSSRDHLFAGGIGIHIVWVSMLMAAVTLGIQWYSLKWNHENAQTMVFMVLSLSQLGHVLAIRSEKTFLFKQGLWTNPALLIIVVFTFILQLLVIYVPAANAIFKTNPLSIEELLLCIGLSAIVFHAVELEKWIKFRFLGKHSGVKHAAKE